MPSNSFRSLAFKGFPDGYSTGSCACMCPPAHRRSEPPIIFLRTRPDENPPTPPPRPWPTLTLYAPSPSLSSFDAASVMMCCSARPASSSAPSVLPEDRIGRNITHVRRCCDHINVRHIFDQTCVVVKLGWRSTTGPPGLRFSSPVPGSPPGATAKSMASSHHVALLCQV